MINSVAICFNGMSSSIKYNSWHLKREFIDIIKNNDVFIYTVDDFFYKTSKYYLDILQPKVLVAEKDKVIRDDFIKKHCFKTGTQIFLQQSYSWKRVNEIRKEYELQNKKKYDIIIRLRLDLKFFNTFDIKFLQNINEKEILIPDFHNFSCICGNGLNDRFAIGSRESMDIYMNMFDSLEKYYKFGYDFHAETLLYYHLKYNNINVKHVPIRFTRIKNNGIMEDEYLKKDKTLWNPMEF